MPRLRFFSTLVLVLATLPAPDSLANPTEIRRATVSIISAMTGTECEFPEEVDWPLFVDGDRIRQVDRIGLCAVWRPRMLVARIADVYAEEFASEHYRRLGFSGTQVYLVDLEIRTSGQDELAEGASLIFDCPQAQCRLIGMMSTPLHRLADRTRVLNPEQEQLMLAGKLAGAISSISPVRIYLLEYYYSMGRWPENLDQAGLDPQAFHSREIEALDVGADGTIRARLSQAFGNGKFLELVPYDETAGASMRWRCRSNLRYELLSELRGLDCRAAAMR